MADTGGVWNHRTRLRASCSVVTQKEDAAGTNALQVLAVDTQSFRAQPVSWIWFSFSRLHVFNSNSEHTVILRTLVLVSSIVHMLAPLSVYSSSSDSVSGTLLQSMPRCIFLRHITHTPVRLHRLLRTRCGPAEVEGRVKGRTHKNTLRQAERYFESKPLGKIHSTHWFFKIGTAGCT